MGGIYMKKLFTKKILSWLSVGLITAASFGAIGTNTVAFAATQTHVSTHSAAKTTSIKIVSSSLYVRHGGNAYITIKTTPGATGTIEVDYKSGPSHAQGLYSQHASKSGIITWSWKVGTRTTKGSWPVDITVNNKTIETHVHVS
jgi:hypothetical protein